MTSSPFVELGRASLELWKELEQTVPGGVGLIELDWIGPPPGPRGSGEVLIRRQARVNPLRALARLAATMPSIATDTAAASVADHPLDLRQQAATRSSGLEQRPVRVVPVACLNEPGGETRILSVWLSHRSGLLRQQV